MNKRKEGELRSIRHVIAASDLPTLTGERLDIERATTIRIEMLMGANDIIARLNSVANASDAPHAHLDETILASRRLRNATSALWWIAHRNMEADTLLQELTHRSYAMEYGGK